MEKFNLSTPVPLTPPDKTQYTLRYIRFDWDAKYFEVGLRDNLGRALSKVYDETTNPTGESLMLSLNKANLSSSSLHRRIFTRLSADGVIETGSTNETVE